MLIRCIQNNVREIYEGSKLLSSFASVFVTSISDLESNYRSVG
jgi:hypothetical protein